MRLLTVTLTLTITFTFMHLADAFIQSDLQCIIHGYSLGIEPTTFALLTQCSTTEPQEHNYYFHYFFIKEIKNFLATYFQALFSEKKCFGMILL